MKMRIQILFCGIALSACNNYGLLEKLENPGGTSSNSNNILKLYAFVTTVKSDADMINFSNGGCSGSGIPRADCACQDLAVANGLQRKSGGVFKAWLSGQIDDMTCRMQGLPNANCTLPTGDFRWYNTNDEPIAVGFSDLLDGTLMNPIKYTELRAVTSSANVWTGTDAGGLRSGAGAGASNCVTWSDVAVANSPAVGSPTAINASWSNTGTPGNCSVGNQNSIYCIALP